jgi:hypothetical protein
MGNPWFALRDSLHGDAPRAGQARDPLAICAIGHHFPGITGADPKVPA